MFIIKKSEKRTVHQSSQEACSEVFSGSLSTLLSYTTPFWFESGPELAH